eukprot:2533950-Amphidinium_carterae.1
MAAQTCGPSSSRRAVGPQQCISFAQASAATPYNILTACRTDSKPHGLQHRGCKNYFEQC